jgi:heme-degrading monooxygenase HmoA
MMIEPTSTNAICYVNAFEVPPEKVDLFLALWRDRAEFFSRQPGFLSLRLLCAQSASVPFQAVIVADWTSVDALQATAVQEGFQESARHAIEELGVIAYPGIYRIVLEMTASGHESE